MTILPPDELLPEMDTRILVVDDDPFILEMLRTSVTAMGHACDTAVDGVEAKDKLEQGGFTMVLTDLTMPRCDGMQLLKHIKEKYPQTEVIIITGHAEMHGYTDVVRAGASDFITKPFSMDELEAKVSRVIREQTLIRKLEHLSMRDMLTGLYNRRCFELKLHEEVPRAHRQGYSIFLALLDVDHFKGYNDQYGHPAGDRVLQDIGSILVRCTREKVDWCFRFGGDEFAIIIPHAAASQVRQIADRILERYGENTLYASTSLTIGLAQFIQRADCSWKENIADLVARADKALYSGKKDGGNRVISDFSLPCPTD